MNKLEERIKELKKQIIYESQKYESQKQEACAKSKSDLMYLDSLENELEKLEHMESDGVACPICGEELECVPYKSKSGRVVYIYNHDNSCPFIGFECVEQEDTSGFIEYLLITETNKILNRGNKEV